MPTTVEVELMPARGFEKENNEGYFLTRTLFTFVRIPDTPFVYKNKLHSTASGSLFGARKQGPLPLFASCLKWCIPLLMRLCPLPSALSALSFVV